MSSFSRGDRARLRPLILCPDHRLPLDPAPSDGYYACPAGCAFASPAAGIIDLLQVHVVAANATSKHYSLQWGSEVDFASFYRSNPTGLSVMTSKQMGWPDLIERVRTRARSGAIHVFDAGCGYGGLFADLFAAPRPEGLIYVGADIHGVLPTIKRPEGVSPDRALFVRWDISDLLPTDQRFDVILCRAVIHHTPDPRATFRSLVGRLAPGGVIAITAYAKKAPMREASDDALRARIVPMTARDAFDLARQFTLLGRDLQASEGTIEIAADLPFLGIKAGRYGVQEFIYDHLLKCWFNAEFGVRYSDVVNFDWYHPPHAYRYEPEEIAAWFAEHDLEVTATRSTKAQHYFEGRYPDG
jgi:SAM-dependent methyltransferase